MQKYKLNGERMTSREAAHQEIAQVLGFPAYYGKNLDALWDLASTMQADVELINPAPMYAALGDYAEKLIATLQEAAEKNPEFRFRIQA